MEFRVILCGKGNVGKISIVKSYIRRDFWKNDCDRFAGFFDIPFETQFGKVKMHIFDTASEENLSSLPPIYFHGAAAALIVFNLNDVDSFKPLQFWIDQFKEKSLNNSIFIIVGNLDSDNCEGKMSVSHDVVNDWVCKRGYPYIEVSPKSGKNIVKLFSDLATELAQRTDLSIPQKKEKKIGIVIDESPKDEKHCGY